MSEGKALILKNSSTAICFEKNGEQQRQIIYFNKQVLQDSKQYLYLGTQEAEPRRKGIRVSVRDIIQEKIKMTTKRQATQKIHINKLHMNLGNPGEDKMCATTKNLYYRIKGMLEVWKDCSTENINHISLWKVAEEWDLKPGKSI